MLLINGINLNQRLEMLILKFRKLILNLDNGCLIFNTVYNIFNPVGLKYLTRLSLELSHLNEHKFKHNF